jgi:hypothetical protein
LEDPHVRASSEGSIDLFGRFARILLTLCLNLIPVPLKNKRIDITQIVELVVFFS